MFFSDEQHKRDALAAEPDIRHLERMNNEEFWDYARQRARAVPTPTLHTEYLECKLSDGVCLLPLHYLSEALPPPSHLAALPGTPRWMAGLMAWHGETIAVVELDAYISPTRSTGGHLGHDQHTAGILLVMRTSDFTLALLIPAFGRTMTLESQHILHTTAAIPPLAEQHAPICAGVYDELPVVNITALLADLVQQIGGAAARG